MYEEVKDKSVRDLIITPLCEHGTRLQEGNFSYKNIFLPTKICIIQLILFIYKNFSYLIILHHLHQYFLITQLLAYHLREGDFLSSELNKSRLFSGATTKRFCLNIFFFRIINIELYISLLNEQCGLKYSNGFRRTDEVH